MSNSSSSRFNARVLGALVALVLVVAALPAGLLAVSMQRFGHLSPLDGMKAPWNWSMADARAWGRQLMKGLDSSAQLVDLFFRLAIVAGWVCLAILLYTVADECWFQVRHGMPSARRRRVIGLGSLGRHLATALVAVLPLSAHATPPALASAMRAPASVVVHDRLPQRDDPIATPAEPAPTLAEPGENGWSVVEVQRGDSIWAIAERFAEGREVSSVARQIVAANLGTVMPDGHRFSTPALIEPGWLLSVPTSLSPAVAKVDAPSPVVAPAVAQQPTGYVVQPGDSYWDIAEQHLAPSARGGEIAAYAQQLMDVNAPLLGYSDARLVRPGDVVQLGEQSATEVEAAPQPIPVAGPTPVETPTFPPPVPVPGPTVAAQQLPDPQDVPPPSILPAPVPVSTAAQTGLPLTSPGPAVHSADDSLAVGSGLAAAVVLAGGAVAALASRRRQQLRGAQVGARLPTPAPELIRTERLLRSLNAAEQLARVDLALRGAAGELVRQQARPLAIEASDEGELRLYTDRATLTAAPRWMLDIESGAWRLPADVTLAELSDDARRSNQPCPALVHIGASAGGQLFFDLEAVGSLSIDAPPEVAASIVRSAAASLAVSPFAETSRVLTFGLGPDALFGNPLVESVSSVSDAVEALRLNVDCIAGATGGSMSTFALRAGGTGGEAWEPTLLLAVGVEDPADEVALVAAAGGGGRGVGLMIGRPVPGAGAVLRAVDSDFVLEPLGRRVTPIGLTVAEVEAVADLFDQAQQPLSVPVDTCIEHHLDASATTPVEFCERPHDLVVHVLGQVAVQSAAGVPIAFDRSKAQELVVWLSQHRTRPTRTSARTALWDLAVRDATFSNVVSDARRAMAKVVAPPEGEEWIARTMTEDLPLHDLVVSDVELLADRLAAAQALDDRRAIDLLRPGVAMIQGMPFAGTSYLWPDAEGITSSLVLLATGAAAELAARCLAIDDIDGVFWATGQGLKVLAGHEELIALRMRAHAGRGDLAGVRSEWESYERALHADSWSAAEPSPKLVDLRRELLSPSMAV